MNSTSPTTTEIEHVEFVSDLVAHILRTADPIPHPPPEHSVRTAVVFDIPLNYERLADGTEVATKVTYRMFTDTWSMEMVRGLTDPTQESPSDWRWTATGDLERWGKDLTLLRLYLVSED